MEWQLTVTILGFMATITTAIIKFAPSKPNNRNNDHIDDLRKELHSSLAEVKDDIKTLSHRIDKFILEMKR